MIVSRRSEALTAPDREPGPDAVFRSTAPADALPMPAVEGVEHRFVAVNGATLHYAGAGSGDPLVLLHGWPQHWWAWREVIPTLAKSYRLICPDIRGFGWSQGGPDYSFEQLAADVVGLLDVLGLERARFAGHGWGAEIGHHACLNWPGRFSHYVSVGGPAPWPSGVAALRPLLRSWQICALGLLGAAATTRLAVPESALRSWRHVGDFAPAEMQIYLAPLRRPVSAEATTRLHRQVLLHELPHHMRGGRGPLRVPTLHVHGEHDPFAGRVPGGDHRGSADTRFELFRGCGHFVAEECPAQLLERLSGFLA